MTDTLRIDTPELLLTHSTDRLKALEEWANNHFSQRVNDLFPWNPPQLITTDVFDTLLLRPAISELHHFFLIAQKQTISINKEFPESSVNVADVLFARYFSTKISYGLSRPVQGCREGSIIEITEGMCRVLRIEKSFASQLIAVELEHEKEVLTPNIPLWNALKNLKTKANCPLIGISDMYLHREHILELLTHAFEDAEIVLDELYSSADSKISKGSGKLFLQVIEDMELSAPNALHLGDSLITDFQKPAEVGMKAIHLPLPLLHIVTIKADEDTILTTLNDKYELDLKPFVQ